MCSFVWVSWQFVNRAFAPVLALPRGFRALGEDIFINFNLFIYYV